MDCIMNSVHHTCLYLNLSFILENMIMRHVPHESNGGPAPRTPAMTPQVYTAGTYPALLRRTPSEPANFRPAQFSFLSQPDHRTAGEPSEEGDGGLPSNPPSLAPPAPSAGPVKHGTREAGTIYGAGIRHPSCLYSDARVRSDQCRLPTLFS